MVTDVVNNDCEGLTMTTTARADNDWDDDYEGLTAIDNV